MPDNISLARCHLNKSPGGSGDDANKKEVRDLCRAAVLLRFGY